ncbi:hypothetical protein XYCOK13_25140 [Xylanibacillus composti]|uniref:Aminoglycoside-2''-adenylyltransferase n=1 Tax=Xylanibacillus composti TaxID=1572762 RepID=A0A8J4M2B8_9BACL|nr:hypothetical protein [Xylanibacillus composti]GIQ69690.1 hypothetical protein XYCOK13_25140 [Xylanibacillus composti]
MNEMKHFQKPWFISGGWAIDLAIGCVTRSHKDIDICVFREDTNVIFDYFHEWEIHVAIPGEHRLEPCTSKEDVHPPRYCLHLFKEKDFIEILLTERQGENVKFRKNREIWMNVSEFSHVDNQGRPYVDPAWQLLFKGLTSREQDEHDFYTFLPNMNEKQRTWLRKGLSIMKPDSKWMQDLKEQ